MGERPPAGRTWQTSSFQRIHRDEWVTMKHFSTKKLSLQHGLYKFVILSKKTFITGCFNCLLKLENPVVDLDCSVSKSYYFVSLKTLPVIVVKNSKKLQLFFVKSSNTDSWLCSFLRFLWRRCWPWSTTSSRSGWTRTSTPPRWGGRSQLKSAISASGKNLEF